VGSRACISGLSADYQLLGIPSISQVSLHNRIHRSCARARQQALGLP
jgi:hypothetical protein